jgi:methylated-DNA-protein-cysteine methyltransferase-like protein
MIWKVVRRIPRGRVATYGQIAELAGLEGHARQVGYALHNLPGRSDVPWHRVINSRGEISPRSAGDSHELQRMLLESEGVVFDARGRVELKRYQWKQVARSPGRPVPRRRETE